MKLLYITAHPSSEEKSASRKLSRSFIESYKQVNPNCEVEELNLYEAGIDFLTEADIDLKHAGDDNKMKPFAEQFASADRYVFASAFWNLNMPAILKAYIDYITYFGITFTKGETGLVGLLNDRKAIYIVTSGAKFSDSDNTNAATRQLAEILQFFGINDFTPYLLENTNHLPPEQVASNFASLERDLIQAATEF